MTSLFDNPAALYDSEPGSPGTPPPRSGSDHEDSNPPPITPRTAVPPQLAGTSMANTAPSMSMAELNKITSTAPPTSFLNLSVPPPRVLPPTNLPPPMARFGPPPMFSTMPPPHFGNPPPTNIPPPGFANPPPPGMPPHQFASGPFGYPPPMRPHMQPNRYFSFRKWFRMLNVMFSGLDLRKVDTVDSTNSRTCRELMLIAQLRIRIGAGNIDAFAFF